MGCGSLAEELVEELEWVMGSVKSNTRAIRCKAWLRWQVGQIKISISGSVSVMQICIPQHEVIVMCTPIHCM